MIRRALLRLLGAPSLPAALARIEQLTARVDELEVNKAALTIQADSEERRADEAERLLDRERMINSRLDEKIVELAKARDKAADAAPLSWLVPRATQAELDAAPHSIRPAGETVLRAEVATLRRELRACGCSTRAKLRSDLDDSLGTGGVLR